MRVEFASLIALWNVDLGQVSDASNLDVVRCLDEMRASDRAIRDNARTVAALDTPRDLDTLSVSDVGGSTGVRRCEETEVVERVHCVRQGSAFDVPGLSNNRRQWVVETLTIDVLAHGVLVVAGAAFVGAGLALFRLVGGVIWGVRRRVCLGEDRGCERERDEGSEAEHREKNGRE